MDYRLIALDLDGTLVGPDLEIHPRDRAAIQQAEAAGTRVTLATGRGFPAAREYAQKLSLTTPVICYQGGLLRDPVSEEVLYTATLPPDLYAEAVEQAMQQELDFQVYVGDTVCLRDMPRGRQFYDRWFGLPYRQVNDLITEVEQPPIKFLITANEEEADEIERTWKAHFDGRLQIVRSHRLFVEGTSPGVSKGNALARLADRLGIEQAAVIAIGDNDNDRSMIQWAGLGVAMGGAPEDLKSDADHVAPPQSEAGVAHVIEQFVLHAQR